MGNLIESLNIHRGIISTKICLLEQMIELEKLKLEITDDYIEAETIKKLEKVNEKK
jgi:hypothetical protein